MAATTVSAGLTIMMSLQCIKCIFNYVFLLMTTKQNNLSFRLAGAITPS